MIKVGITNIKKEELNVLRENSPKQISYCNIKPAECGFDGFYFFPKKLDVDLIESTLPCITPHQSNIQVLRSIVFSFEMPGVDFDRKKKLDFWRKMVLRKECKKVILESKAVYNFMTGSAKYFGGYYAKIRDKEILRKATVVYPAVKHLKYNKKEHDRVNILFKSNSFYKDGGEQVLNAFLKLKKQYDNLNLMIISKDIEKGKGSYTSVNHNKLIAEIKKNKSIVLNPDEKIAFEKADIFAKPTTKDHEGFSLIEPMNHGLPVISTDFLSIPEIVENNKEGLLIKIMNYNYTLHDYRNKLILSKGLSKYLEKETYSRLKRLVEDKKLRSRLGRNANKKVKTRFSFEKRNKIMKKIYEEAVK